MHNLLRLAPLLAVGLLAACVAGPDYRPPSTAPAAGGPFQSLAPGIDPAAELPGDWWRLYEDPALDQLVEAALAANTDLRVADANLRRARAVLGEAKSQRLPSTTTSGGVTYGRGQTSQGGSFGTGDDQFTEQGGFSAAWELDLFGRVARAIEAAHDDVGAVAAARDGVRVAVASEVTRAYSQACALGASIDVARASLTLADSSYRIVAAQQHAGSASTLDLERSGAAVAQARAAIAPLEGQRRVAIFELAALLGRAPAEVPAVAWRCDRAPETQRAIPIGDGVALLRRRPDLREAERRLAADTARVGVAMADLYPRISLGAAASYGHSDKGMVGPALSYSAGPLVSWTFPNLVAGRSRVRQARATADADLARFDGVVLTSLKEVEQALSVYGADLDERAALVESRDRADRAFRLADLRYRAGSISYLDQIVAQSTLADASARLAASNLRIASDRVGVFKALGGGWQAMPTS